MGKPLIAVVPLFDDEKDSYWMLPGYMKGIEAAGGIPCMLPLTEEKEILRHCAQTFAGFLFTGGHDVSPRLYGEAVLPQCGTCCAKRDAMEQQLLEIVMKQDKPVLGICRGIQLINAALGGSLYQDLPTQRPSNLQHHQAPPYDTPIHSVRLCDETPLQRLLGVASLNVNSYHHQAIKRLSPQLKPMAYAEDQLIEAVYQPDKQFVWAVQWHPEFSFSADENSRKILKAFVAASR